MTNTKSRNGRAPRAVAVLAIGGGRHLERITEQEGAGGRTKTVESTLVRLQIHEGETRRTGSSVISRSVALLRLSSSDNRKTNNGNENRWLDR